MRALRHHHCGLRQTKRRGAGLLRLRSSKGTMITPIETYRARPEPHRRLNRRPKPEITQAEGEALEQKAYAFKRVAFMFDDAVLNKDEVAKLALEPELKTAELSDDEFCTYNLFDRNGIVTERDLRNLREADLKRERRAARN